MAAAAAGDSPNWAMLDRYVVKRYDLHACGDEDGTSSLECRTGQGIPSHLPPLIRVVGRLPLLPHVDGSAENHCNILVSQGDALLEPMDNCVRPHIYDQDLHLHCRQHTLAHANPSE